MLEWMQKDFEHHLSQVAGKVRRIKASSRYDIHNEALLPWWNKAESLHAGALVLWHAGEKADALSVQSLGLEAEFPLRHAIRPVFCALAGLSVEVALKAICRGLERPANHTHSLIELAESSGISVSQEEEIILRAMTEYIRWAGRYPTPLKLERWIESTELFDLQSRQSGSLADSELKESAINMENYLRLWRAFAECFWKVQKCRPESVGGVFGPNE